MKSAGKGIFLAVIALAFGCAHKGMSAQEKPVPIHPLPIERGAGQAKQGATEEAALLGANAKLAAFRAGLDLEQWVGDGKNLAVANMKDTEKLIKLAEGAVAAGWVGEERKDPLYQALLERNAKLSQTARKKCAESALRSLHAFAKKDPETAGTAQQMVVIAAEAVELATSQGEDKDDLRGALATLAGRARIGYAQRMIETLRDCIDGKKPMYPGAVSEAAQAISVALLAGDDVGALASQMYKLRQAACAKDGSLCGIKPPITAK